MSSNWNPVPDYPTSFHEPAPDPENEGGPLKGWMLILILMVAVPVLTIGGAFTLRAMGVLDADSTTIPYALFGIGVFSFIGGGALAWEYVLEWWGKHRGHGDDSVDA